MTASVSFFRRSVVILRLSLGATLLAIPAGLFAADWRSLLDNSPFGGQAFAVNPVAEGELEFRGVVHDEDGYLVNIYNPTTKTAQWIPVNGKAPGLEIQAYDAASDKVQITRAGRPFLLSLKQAHITLAAATPAPAPSAGNAGNPDAAVADLRAKIRVINRVRQLTGTGNGIGVGAIDPKDLSPEAQAMIEEFRRRRAEPAADQNLPPGQP